MKVITGKGDLVRAYMDTAISVPYYEFPENGLDINEQANFISTMQDDKDAVIFTFSPWIISDCREDDVFTVTDELTLRPVNFNTFGASVNKINSKVLGRPKTIGGFASSRMEELRNDEHTTFQLLDMEMGDSVEKLLFIKYLFDREEENAKV